MFAIKKGFIIGNHSYAHPHFSKITKEEAFEQIKKTDKIIEEVYKKSRNKRRNQKDKKMKHEKRNNLFLRMYV